MTTVAKISEFLDRFAPSRIAAEWDNVGLLLGDPEVAVERIMTCLTVTPDVVAEAVGGDANMIVTHHPILFRGVKRLTAASPDGKLLLPLLRNGVAVYSPHTAFDNAPGGINEGLCERLGLSGIRPLRRKKSDIKYKLVVFVPDSDLEKVSDSVFAAGAGAIGNYEQCSFRLAGTGTFYGTDATNPTVGRKGRREHVSEWRFEVVVPEKVLAPVLSAMRSAHSYEEPAYDIYPLKSLPTHNGEGRIGELAAATTLDEFAQRVREVLPTPAVGVVGNSGQMIRRVGVACGAAGEYLTDAIRERVDVFLTGEMRFHDTLAAQAAGLAVLLPGHYATERLGVEDLANRLAEEFTTATVWASREESDPVWWVGS